MRADNEKKVFQRHLLWVLSVLLLILAPALAAQSVSGGQSQPRKKEVPPGLATRGCTIDKLKLDNGALNPQNSCQSCQAATNRVAWTGLADGTECGGGDDVCFEEACCTPVAECGVGQCDLVDDTCGGTLDCGSCLTAFDDIIQINDPLHNSGLTVFPLRLLDNDLIVDTDAVEIKSVTQPVIDFCSNSIGSQSGTHGPTCWRQIGVVSIDPDGLGVTLDLNPGVLPLWNPQHPYDGTKPPKAEACGKGTAEPENVETLGTAENPALFCMTSNSGPWPSLAFMPPQNALTDCRTLTPEPWDFPFEYTIDDGEHESTATATLQMYTPPCITVPIWASLIIVNPPPPPPPLPQPNLITNTLTIVPPLPPDAPVGTPPPTIGPSLTLNTDVITSNLDIGTISGWDTPGVTMTLPATCPEIPGVEFSTCEVTGQFAIDPGAAPILLDPNGVVVQLTDPLDVTGDDTWRGFVSVQISSVLSCEECAIKRYWGTLFGGATPSCYLSINGNKCSADCVTGELFPDLPTSSGCTK